MITEEHDIAAHLGQGQHQVVDRKEYISAGATIHERMKRALETSYIAGNKSELVRSLPGVKAYTTVHGWLEGTSLPRLPGFLEFCEAVGVAASDLLDPEGHTVTEPQYEAWRLFLETPLGNSMSPGERRALASMDLDYMEKPDPDLYAALLFALRGARKG